MPWLKITPDDEDAEFAPEPLSFRVRDLTVGEQREYRAKGEALTQQLADIDIGTAPDEEADDIEKAAYGLKLNAATQRMAAVTAELGDLMIETHVAEVEGYDSIDDVPDFYLQPMREKTQDFLEERRNLGWSLVVGTAQAKPSKGRK